MKLYSFVIFLVVFFSGTVRAQLSFCPGDTGDAIFTEDFGTGTTNGPALPAGFTTYTYVDQGPQDGFYTISSDLSQLTSWHNVPDNTPNDTNGKAFIVNASFTADEFFRRPISGLCENTFYEFSAAVVNLYDSDFTNCPNGGIPVNVRFEIWNESDTILLGSGDTGDINGTPEAIWNNYGLVFETTAGQESVLLKMINNGDGGCGNDLAIDDITFKACGDSTLVTTTTNEQGVQICETETPSSTTLVATTEFVVNDSYELQWQSSTNMQDWFPIPGATSPILEVIDLTETTYFRVNLAVDADNLGSPFCSLVSEPFLIEVSSLPDPPISNGDQTGCSDDPFPSLSVTVQAGQNVNWYDAPIAGNLLASNTTVFTPNTPGTFYAEALINGIDCASPSRTAVTLTIFPSVNFDPNQETIEICEGDTILLSAPLSNLSYSWSTGATSQSIEIDTPGVFVVTASSGDSCSDQKTFMVNAIPIPEIVPIEINNGSQIIIETSNTGDFEYSLNGVIYQDAPLFTDVPSGIVTAFVRNVAGCPPSISTFYNIRIPSFFTPNGDGINDFFTLPDLQFFTQSELQIFDRFGKLLYADSGTSLGWDGTYRGNRMPVTDYWYILTLDNIQITGHVSLIVRG